jgi:hypothetical protein
MPETTKPTLKSVPQTVAKRAIKFAADQPATAPTPAPSLQPADSADGRIRAVIDAVLPIVDGGRFAVKAIAGEAFEVTAHCFTDGHDVVRAMLRWRAEGDSQPQEVPMTALPNDVWTAEFTPPAVGRYFYGVAAWVDPFESWRYEMVRRIEAEDIRIAAQVGALEIAAAAERAAGADRESLAGWAKQLLRRSRRWRWTSGWPRWRCATRTAGSRRCTRSSCRCSPTACGPASAPGTSCSRGPRLASPASTAPSATSSTGCRPSPRWVSTCCISRRSIRSAGCSARARTTPW